MGGVKKGKKVVYVLVYIVLFFSGRHKVLILLSNTL